MPKKYSFPELGCSSCEHLQRVGGVLCETRYCGGFSQKEKAQEISVVQPQIQGTQVVSQAAAHPGMPDL